MGYKCVDMHLHTEYSDGLSKIEDLIKIYKKRKLGFAITDHVTIKGAIKACKHNTKNNTFFIPGIEFGARNGKEVLFYFYNIDELKEFYEKEVKKYKLKFFKQRTNRLLLDIVQLGKDYNCVSSLAHPRGILWKNTFKILSKNEKYFKKNLTAIEAINSGLNNNQNGKVIDYIKNHDYAYTAGSDAHSTVSLGSAITFSKADNVGEFLDNIRKKRNYVIGEKPKDYNKNYLYAKTKLMMNKIFNSK